MRHLSALVALALAACVSPAPLPGSAGYLSGTSWVRVDDPNAPRAPTIEFENARASGFAGCNRWFAAVTHDGEALRFGDVGTTRMACTADAAQETERSFLAALAATRYGHYDRDALVLLDEQRNVIARFERAGR